MAKASESKYVTFLFPGGTAARGLRADVGAELLALEADEVAGGVSALAGLLEGLAECHHVEHAPACRDGSPSALWLVPAWKTDTPSSASASSIPRMTLPFS